MHFASVLLTNKCNDAFGYLLEKVIFGAEAAIDAVRHITVVLLVLFEHIHQILAECFERKIVQTKGLFALLLSSLHYVIEEFAVVTFQDGVIGNGFY